MFVQLDHLKTKELQSNLDAIEAVFEVSLFDIKDASRFSNTRTIHQQMLLNCESLAIEKSLDLNVLAAEKLDHNLLDSDIDSFDNVNLFPMQNWFLSLLHNHLSTI